MLLPLHHAPSSRHDLVLGRRIDNRRNVCESRGARTIEPVRAVLEAVLVRPVAGHLGQFHWRDSRTRSHSRKKVHNARMRSAEFGTVVKYAVAQLSVEGFNLIECDLLDRPASKRFGVRWIRRRRWNELIHVCFAPPVIGDRELLREMLKQHARLSRVCS